MYLQILFFYRDGNVP